jgi:hypothetical protein
VAGLIDSVDSAERPAALAGPWPDTTGSGDPPAEDGDMYQVVNLGDDTFSVRGGPVLEGCEPNPAPDIRLDLGAGQSIGIAVSADGDVTPHDVELFDTPPAVYVSIVAEFLAARDVIDPEPDLLQVIRTDLEGDGVDEILIAAQRNTSGTFTHANGDYSVLLLRKIVQGNVETAVIDAYFAEDLVEPPPFPTFIWKRLSAVADLNGDGKMEIVFESGYYEGSSTILVEYANDDLGPINVLSAGCGA